MINPPQPFQFPLMSSAYWNFHSIQRLVTFLELFNSFCWNIFWPPPPLSAMEMWSFTTLNWWVTMNAEILVLNCQKCKQCLKWFHVSRIALSLFSVVGFFIFFLSCYVIQSLWSNVSKLKSLQGHSLRVFSKYLFLCLCLHSDQMSQKSQGSKVILSGCSLNVLGIVTLVLSLLSLHCHWLFVGHIMSPIHSDQMSERS